MTSAAPVQHADAIRLFPHQVAAARRLRALLDTFGGALLADEPGMGKTFTALEVAKSYRRVFVLSPAVLGAMWRESAARAGVAIEWVSYERLSARGEVKAGRCDLLVLDEAHHLRNPNARRYRVVASVACGARVLLLSATPVHNSRTDLTTILALFLGSGVGPARDEELARLIVRRRIADVDGTPSLAMPSLRTLRWEALSPAPAIADAIVSLPPPVPALDGGRADALVRLSMLRAWCSSDAAILDAIGRRLAASAALEQALSEGRHPTRRELHAWSGSVDSIQLGFASLLASTAASDASLRLTDLAAYCDGLRALRARLTARPDGDLPTESRDEERFARLRRLIDMRGSHAAVVFTHARATAFAAYRALLTSHRVALLTGEHGLIATGTVPRAEVLAAFARPHPSGAHGPGSSGARDWRDGRAPELLRIDALIATDVVSEGINLPEAGLVVHLDLPWTPARLEQRVGRARRIGARASEVLQVALAPPLDGDELRLIVHHLAEKGGIAHRLIGESLPAGTALVPSRGGAGASQWGATDAIARVHAIADAIARMLSQRHARPHASFDAEVTTPPWLYGERRAAAVALVEHLLLPTSRAGRTEPAADDAHGIHRERELVLIDESGGAIVATSHVPEAFLTAIRALPRAGAHRWLDRCDADHPPNGRALALLRRWCQSRDAEDATLAAIPQRSRSHAAMQRRIQLIEQRSSRIDRGATLAAAAEARDAVLGVSGVGAERLLEELLSAPDAPAAGGRLAVPWLRRVQQVLADRAVLPTIRRSPRGVVGFTSILPNE